MSQSSTVDVDALVAAAASGEPRAREELLLHYRYLVEHLANRMGSSLPPSVDRDDLAGYGIFGLITAIDVYDPKLNKNFEAHATDRIKAAIVDGLRSYDWVPKRVHRRTRAVDQARAKLEASLRRSPTEAEIAGELGITADRVARVIGDAANTTLMPLDETVFEMASPDAHAMLVDVEQLRANLAAAIVALPRRERIVFTLYYFEEITFEVIGEYLGVSKPRVSAIRDDAILRVRASLAGRA